jgi:exonuclease VII large subunit
MKIIFTLILTLLSYSAYAENIVPETAWIVSEKILSCKPSILKLGQTLEVKLGKNHGKELAVRRHRDNHWFFLVVGSPPSDMKSLMTPEEFKNTKEFKIEPDTTGYEWIANGKNKKIFAEEGEYSIYTSDILESEVGGFVCHLKVLNH